MYACSISGHIAKSEPALRFVDKSPIPVLVASEFCGILFRGKQKPARQEAAASVAMLPPPR
jgi:hypothetical protein